MSDHVGDDGLDEHHERRGGKIIFDQREGTRGENDVAEIDEGADENIFIHAIPLLR